MSNQGEEKTEKRFFNKLGYVLSFPSDEDYPFKYESMKVEGDFLMIDGEKFPLYDSAFKAFVEKKSIF